MQTFVSFVVYNMYLHLYLEFHCGRFIGKNSVAREDSHINDRGVIVINFEKTLRGIRILFCGRGSQKFFI